MPQSSFLLPFDSTGSLASNYIQNDVYQTPQAGLLIPQYGAYYGDTLVVKDAQGVVLTRGIHYQYSDFLIESSRELARGVYCSVIILPAVASPTVRIDARYLGGEAQANKAQFFAAYNAALDPTRVFQWNEVLHPAEFAPAPHAQQLYSFYDMDKISVPVSNVEAALRTRDTAVHDHLLQKAIPAALDDFAQLYNTRLNGINDTLDTRAGAVMNQLSWVKMAQGLFDTKVDYLNKQLQILTQRNSRQKKYFQNVKKAVAAKAIAGRWRLTNRVFDTPLYIDNLTTWFDFSRIADNNTTYWRDHSGAPRSMTLNGATVSNGVLNVPALGTTQISGAGIPIHPETTVILVTSKDYSGMLLFSGQEWLVDLNQNKALEIGNDLKARKYTSGQTKEIMVYGFSGADQEAYFLSSANAKQYGGHFGYEKKVAMTANSFGGLMSLNDSSGGVCEILIYDRLLSLYEIDAINDYYQNKYGIGVCINSNPYFTGGWHDFDYTYSRQDQALLPGQCAIVNKAAGVSYGNHLFNFALAIVPVGHSLYTLIHTTDKVLIPWTDRINSPAGTQLRVSVTGFVGLGQSIDLSLYADNVLVGQATDLTNQFEASWVFRPTGDDVILKLLQMRAVKGIKYAFSSIRVERYL